jgi:hypothetical protein
MIRIYTDEPEGLALAIHEKSVEIYGAPPQFVSAQAWRRQPVRRGIGLITAALLVLLAGGAGYVVAPRHDQARAASAPPLAYREPARAPTAAPIAQQTPPTGPAEVQRELATTPTVTPPRAAPVARPSASGPAAFGLQQ